MLTVIKMSCDFDFTVTMVKMSCDFGFLTNTMVQMSSNPSSCDQSNLELDSTFNITELQCNHIIKLECNHAFKLERRQPRM